MIVIVVILIVILSIFFSGSMRWLVHYSCEPLKDIIFKKGSCCSVGARGPPCACVYPWDYAESLCNEISNKIVNNTESWIPPPESNRVPSPIQEFSVIGK